MAIGCQQYRACHSGGCPVGIATQNFKLRGRLDIHELARRLTEFLTRSTAMMVDFARICGATRWLDSTAPTSPRSIPSWHHAPTWSGLYEDARTVTSQRQLCHHA
jgi:hypothetical protein